MKISRAHHNLQEWKSHELIITYYNLSTMGILYYVHYPLGVPFYPNNESSCRRRQPVRREKSYSTYYYELL